jgi:hypothetical protein
MDKTHCLCRARATDGSWERLYTVPCTRQGGENHVNYMRMMTIWWTDWSYHGNAWHEWAIDGRADPYISISISALSPPESQLAGLLHGEPCIGHDCKLYECSVCMWAVGQREPTAQQPAFVCGTQHSLVSYHWAERNKGMNSIGTSVCIVEKWGVVPPSLSPSDPWFLRQPESLTAAMEQCVCCTDFFLPADGV